MVVAVAVVVVVVGMGAHPISYDLTLTAWEKKRQATERMSEIPHYEESASQRVK